MATQTPVNSAQQSTDATPPVKSTAPEYLPENFDKSLPEISPSASAIELATAATVPKTIPVKPVPQEIIDEKTALLENVFNTIHTERMVDVPILNDKLKVKVIGFQQWQNSYLCIMLTPWFMNIMLLPGEDENWDDKRETTSSRHTFPSGNYEFLVGFEPDIGKYQMCSLFSPMFEFADNDAAVETADVAIRELMNSENIEQTDIDSAQIEAIWDGTEEHPDKIAAREAAAKAKAEAPPRKPLKERMNEPVSRRRLLRGALMLEDDKETITTTAKSTTRGTVSTSSESTKNENTKIAGKAQHK